MTARFRALLIASGAAIVSALPALPLAFRALVASTYTPLGRDQGIFQYVAWAILRGDVDYRDIRDVNGPLTHLVHTVFLLLGGADPHVFRTLDAIVTSVSFAAVGACLPGIAGDKRPTWTDRALWATAAWVALVAQHLGYKYWDLAQRESFFDWFMLPSVVLLLPALGLGRKRLILVAGLLSAIPWLGKPTYAIFTLVQIATLVFDRSSPLALRERLSSFAIGCAAGAFIPFAFLVVTGDVGRYFTITLHDVPTMYRYIMVRPASEILTVPWAKTACMLSFATSAAMVGLLVMRKLPLRTLPVALVSLCGIVSVVAQGKGFPYHYHPVSAGLVVQWVFLLVWLTERFSQLPVVALAASVLLAWRNVIALEASPHLADAAWLQGNAQTKEARESAAYFAHYSEWDYFPHEVLRAAVYVRDHTREGERVAVYGMDPYLLFLANRLSASPYIYGYDLDADGALANAPSPAQPAIRAMRDEHERDFVERVQKTAPTAVVFVDNAPLFTRTDAVQDFREHCPQAAAWVDARFHHAMTFGHVRVFVP